MTASARKALNDVRFAQAKRMQGDGYEPVLTKSRWCLLKHPEKRTPPQELQLKELTRYNLHRGKR
jgi:transposase